jgi:hypothetical protein
MTYNVDTRHHESDARALRDHLARAGIASQILSTLHGLRLISSGSRARTAGRPRRRSKRGRGRKPPTAMGRKPIGEVAMTAAAVASGHFHT